MRLGCLRDRHRSYEVAGAAGPGGEWREGDGISTTWIQSYIQSDTRGCGLFHPSLERDLWQHAYTSISSQVSLGSITTSAAGCMAAKNSWSSASSCCSSPPASA